MGWQPPPRDRRQRPHAVPPNTHPSHFGNRARVLLMLTLIVTVSLPGISMLRRVFNRFEPCSQAGSIVEETRLSEVRPDALYTMLPEHPLHWPLTIDEPTDLAFALHGHGSTPGAEEDWRAALTSHGFRDGRLLVWSESPGDESPMIWAHTNEFASPGDAFAFHRWAAQWSCRFMADVFEVSRLPGAVGTRFHWRDGHESEQVSFVLGSLREVIAANVDDTYRRDDLIALASAAYEEAERPGICETGVHVAPSSNLDHAMRPRDLLSVAPKKLGGAQMSNSDHATSYRVLYGETVAWAFAAWQGPARFVSLEILQFGSAERAAEWTQRTLRHACGSGGAVVRTGPWVIAGSLELVAANPRSVTRYIYFLRGPRCYRIAISGSPIDTPYDFVTTVASAVNESAR